jgi:CBS domain-containing protein
MKVRDVMMRTPASCTPEMNLGAVVEIMWNRNCGFLPVVDRDCRVQGVVTDRDVCIALGTRNRLPGDIAVAEVARSQFHSCRPDEDIHAALQAMQKLGVRRLPVVDGQGALLGVLSMDDLVRHAQVGKIADFSTDEVFGALKAICSHELPVLAERESGGAAFAN